MQFKWFCFSTQGLCATLGLLAQDPAIISFVKPACPNPELISAGQAHESVDRMDLGKAFGGGLYMAKGKELYEWRQTDRGQRFLQMRGVPAPMPAPGVKGFLSRSIWRNGAFYCAAEREIYRKDGATGPWMKVLDSPKPFEAFDVSPDGDLALLGTAGNLIEMYHEGAESPFHEVGYPALEFESRDKVFSARLWRTLKPSVCDEFLILYAGDLGRLYSYDFRAKKLREALVPWKPLATKGLAQRASADSMVLCNGYPSPGCIQIIPDEGLSVKVVYSIRTIEVLPKADPRQKMPSIRYTEGKNPPLRSFDWDLVGNGHSEPVDEPGLAFPVWLNSRGFLEPLGRVLAKVQADPAPSSASKPNRARRP